LFSNFTEETCTGTGATLALAGATTSMIPFSESFADGDLVAYVVEDSGGTIKVAGVGAYVSATDDITRADTWNWNGTAIDNNPSTNIALSGGTHTVRCDATKDSLFATDVISTEGGNTIVGENLFATSVGAAGITLASCKGAIHRFTKTVSVDSFSCRVTTASAASEVAKIVCYRMERPANLENAQSAKVVAETSTFAIDSTGDKSVSHSATLPSGIYLIMLIADDTAVRFTSFGLGIGMGAFGLRLSNGSQEGGIDLNGSTIFSGWESGDVAADDNINTYVTSVQNMPIIGIGGSM